MDLRDKLIRLANSKPELRKHLLPLIKEAGLSWKKDSIVIKVPYGDGEDIVEGFTVGNWGIHKVNKKQKWNLSLLSEGKSLISVKSLKMAKEILETLVASDPSLLNASLSQLNSKQTLIRTVIDSVKYGELYVDPILRKSLVNLGTRYGKGGDHWGIKGGSMMIRVGPRDIVLMDFSPEWYYGKVKGTWYSLESMSRKKVTEQSLNQWIKRVKRAPYMKDLRQDLRDESRTPLKHLTDDGHSFRLQP